MGREELLCAKTSLAAAYRLYDRTLDGAGRILTAETELRFLLAKRRSDELRGAAVITSALSELAENLVATGNDGGVFRCGVEQESARFMAAAASEDGLTWPIQVMQAGFGRGRVDLLDSKLAGLPHFFPTEVVAQVAKACNNARFGRRHPVTDAEETDPSRVAGYLDSGRMSGSAAHATLHLFENEKDIQGKLLAAKNADKLDLFGTSVLAYFSWRLGKPEGRDAMVAQKLGRLVSLDFVTEPGAGGRFLQGAAS